MTNKVIRYALPLVALLSLACTKTEAPERSEVPEVPVTIRTFADAGSDTKLLNGSEAAVRSVRIYIFDGPTLDRMQYFGPDALATGMEMRAKVKSSKLFCAVVNEPTTLSEALDRVATPTELNALMFSLADYMNLNRSVSETDAPQTEAAYYLPFYGQNNNVTVTEDGPNVVQLDIYRAVARVDVYLRTIASSYVNCDVIPTTTLTVEHGAEKGYFTPATPNTVLGPKRTLSRPETIRLSPATDAADKSDYQRIYSYYLPAQQFTQDTDRIQMTFDGLDWEGNKASYPAFRMGDLIAGYDNTIQRNTIYKIYGTLSQITFRVDVALHIEDWEVKRQHGDI